jgi:hypothetical protein
MKRRSGSGFGEVPSVAFLWDPAFLSTFHA